MSTPLQLSSLALAVLLLPVCLGIMVSALCRLNIMTPKVNKRAWMLMYFAMGVFAAGELASALQTASWPEWWELVGLAAVALNLLLTHRHWRDGSPQITRKECRR